MERMMKKISTWGVGAVVIYILLIGWLFYVASGCSGMFCGAVIVLGILPWPIIFEDGINLTMGNFILENDSMIWYWIAVVFNGIIIYFIFSALQKWVSRRSRDK